MSDAPGTAAFQIADQLFRDVLGGIGVFGAHKGFWQVLQAQGGESNPAMTDKSYSVHEARRYLYGVAKGGFNGILCLSAIETLKRSGTSRSRGL